jgi:hypothetical protein
MPIRNYGISWNKEIALALGMLGKRRGEKPVDFTWQIGIYTLERNGETIYVGQSGVGAGASIAARLFDHSKKRKWDTFSWFGIRQVRPTTGTLVRTPRINMETGSVIKDIEALAIGLLEPLDNMRAGRYRHMVEYLQLTKGWEE